jgi:hypothetical protein
MGDIRNEFVPIELADRLQLLGFNEPCIAWYYGKDLWMVDQKESEPINYRQNPIRGGNGILAPLYQQAFRWFRDEYGMSGSIQIEHDAYQWSIYEEGETSGLASDNWDGTDYEEAELACLKKLIEIVEQEEKEL